MIRDVMKVHSGIENKTSQHTLKTKSPNLTSGGSVGYWLEGECQADTSGALSKALILFSIMDDVRSDPSFLKSWDMPRKNFTVYV